MFFDELTLDKTLQPYFVMRSRKGGTGISKFGKNFGTATFNTEREDILKIITNYINPCEKNGRPPHPNSEKYGGNLKFYAYIGSMDPRKALLSDQWVSLGDKVLEIRDLPKIPKPVLELSHG